MTDNTWFDPTGNVIKQLPSGSSAFVKNVYDGLGRQTTKYVGYDLTEMSYADASSVSDDTIMEQVEPLTMKRAASFKQRCASVFTTPRARGR